MVARGSSCVWSGLCSHGPCSFRSFLMPTRLTSPSETCRPLRFVSMKALLSKQQVPTHLDERAGKPRTCRSSDRPETVSANNPCQQTHPSSMIPSLAACKDCLPSVAAAPLPVPQCDDARDAIHRTKSRYRALCVTKQPSHTDPVPGTWMQRSWQRQAVEPISQVT